jgi:hypothetical protein
MRHLSIVCEVCTPPIFSCEYLKGQQRRSSTRRTGDLQQMGLRRDRFSESEGKPLLSCGKAIANIVEDNGGQFGK